MSNDVEMVRCPACRGMKKVPKLGGMIGDCNQCKGKGEIKVVDKVEVKAVIPEPVIDIKKAVAQAIPFKAKEEEKPEVKDEPKEQPKAKIDGKKAVFKRKKG
jgi:microcompartment protein CcmL/EutN